MSRESQIKQIVTQYIDYWNNCDVNKILGSFTEGAVYEDTALQVIYSGSSLLEYLQATFDYCTDGHYELTDEITVVGENRAILQLHMHGHNTEDGKVFSVNSAEFIDLSGDKFKRVKVYYDYEADMRDVEFGSEYYELESTDKYQRSGLTHKQLMKHKVELLVLMGDEKPFKDNELTMPKLADMLQISNNHLSQLINSQFKVNFFDFINEYRVREAKVILSEQTDSRRDSILEVALAVGFNSTSTFYTAFRKFAGMTPVQFKKETAA